MKKKHEKELTSLRRRMPPNTLIWFNSLSIYQQYDFLFEWKRFKFFKGVKKFSLRHFTKVRKKSYKYRISRVKYRDVKIDFILDKK